MVHSPMYHRLMRFVEDAKANESLSDYDSKHKATLEAMKEDVYKRQGLVPQAHAQHRDAVFGAVGDGLQ